MSPWSRPPDLPPPRWRRPHGLTLATAALIYAALTAAQWSEAYIDFGDGNYRYIAWRLAEGVVIYRDLLAPQPPCHLFVGAAIVKLAQWLGVESPLYFFRAFSLLLRLANAALVVRLAWQAWGRPPVAVAAGLIYLWLPIGHWWSLGYQSEPLEIFFLLLMLERAMQGTRGGDWAAGGCAALAALTNATAAPFLLVMILYAALRIPRRALRMVVPCIVLAGSIVAALEAWTGGWFIRTAVFNQVGTFPRENVWAIAINKLFAQWSGVAIHEGAFVVLAVVGVARLVRSGASDPIARGALAWFALATLGSIVYVVKSGTMDYIFSLAEPAVAILAAGELAAWWQRGRRPSPALQSVAWGAEEPPPPSVGPVRAVSAVTLVAVAVLPGLALHSRLWRQMPPFEAPADQAQMVVQLLRRASGPEDRVLAPPHYAVQARRRLWQDYSELLIWRVLYWNDRAAGRPDGQGWSKARAMAQAIEQRELPIVILEMDQTGEFPEVMLALQRTYRPLRTDLIQTTNTRLGVFVPDPPAAPPAVAAETRERWRVFKQRLMELYGPQGVQRHFRLWYDEEP